MKRIIGILLFPLFIFSSCTEPDGLIRSVGDLQSAISSAQAGDTLWLGSGEWKDVTIDFQAKGTKDAPIVIAAKQPGEFILSGNSRLHISGTYGVVSGLHFNTGFSEEGSVISFRAAEDKTIANHCRVTDCAITAFSNPDRMASDHWVIMYGKNNRFDHNYIGNKLNLGTTMIVRLDNDEEPEFHQIDHNYFAHRSRMGSNGGETMRIGTSARSLSSSQTSITENYFDRCNGEVEIVSIKSSDNTIARNVFHECEGVLTMRHGNRNKVEGNYFIGNGKPNTGGIRLINAGHTVEGNYLSGLTGSRFYSALPVMNGVPNSPINRYHQVRNVTIRNNVFIDCKNIAFGIGSDKERTAVPVETSFTENIVYSKNPAWKIARLDDMDGITISENIINSEVEESDDFRATEMRTYATKENLIGIDGLVEPKYPVTKDQCGPQWLDKATIRPAKPKGGTTYTLTLAGLTDLPATIASMNDGDTLNITEAGAYKLEEPLAIKKNLFIISTADNGFAVFEPAQSLKGHGLLEVHDGAHLYLDGVHLRGRADGGDASYGITSIAPMIEHFGLTVKGCRFSDFKESKFAAIHAGKSTFADSVTISDCWFKEFSGHGIVFASEKDDLGRYNVEYIDISNCVFANMMGMAINIYRGGNDESTLGPFSWVKDCTFINVNNKELGSVIRLLGVQFAEVEGCNFVRSGASGRAIFFEDPWWASISISDCNLHQSGRIQTFYDHRTNRESMTAKPIAFDLEALDDWQLKPASQQ